MEKERMPRLDFDKYIHLLEDGKQYRSKDLFAIFVPMGYNKNQVKYAYHNDHRFSKVHKGTWLFSLEPPKVKEQPQDKGEPQVQTLNVEIPKEGEIEIKFLITIRP